MEDKSNCGTCSDKTCFYGGSYSDGIAKTGLKIGAIKINPEKPFLWASGYWMPIYNDNRQFMWYPDAREKIINGFIDQMKDGLPDVVAGTASAGIPWGAWLAQRLNLPFVYVREKQKDHGMRKRLEGLPDGGFQQKGVALIEDLISTGESSKSAADALREANGILKYCLSIFNYGISGQQLEGLGFKSLLDFNTLLHTAVVSGYINKENLETLLDWKKDPFNWGEKHGLAKR